MTKDELRASMKEKRRSAGRDWVRLTSEAVQERVLAMPEFTTSRVVGCYVATSLEVRTDRVLQFCWADADRRVCVPAYRRDLGVYGFAWLDGDGDLVTGHANIREPRDASWVPPADIDIVLVPGLAFDVGCGRLGRGGGYYDRLLADCGLGADAHKAGVAFDFQVVDRVPVSQHDVVLDSVVTETRIFRTTDKKGLSGP